MSACRSAPLDAARSSALELLRSGARFLLVGHSSPDGDCLGSQTALARVLQTLGKEVRVLNPDPIDRRFAHLTRSIRFETWQSGALPAHDVAVLLDFADPSRAGRLGVALLSAPSRKLVIDHHLHQGDAWWDEAYVDPHASATGLLVLRIAGELGVELDSAAAEGVFTALVTDTGWFRYPNTDAETLHAAGELVASGVDPARLYRALHQRQGAEHPRILGNLLAGVQYHAQGRLAVAALEGDVGGSYGADVDEALDVLRSVEVVEVVLVLRETRDGRCRLSARSKGDYDVYALARRFGGGGHRRASGATLEGPLAEARARIVAAAVEGFTDGEDTSARARTAGEGKVAGR